VLYCSFRFSYVEIDNNCGLGSPTLNKARTKPLWTREPHIK